MDQSNSRSVRNTRPPFPVVTTTVVAVGAIALYVFSMVPVSLLFSSGAIPSTRFLESAVEFAYEPVIYPVSHNTALFECTQSYGRFWRRILDLDPIFCEVSWWHRRRAAVEFQATMDRITESAIAEMNAAVKEANASSK